MGRRDKPQRKILTQHEIFYETEHVRVDYRTVPKKLTVIRCRGRTYPVTKIRQSSLQNWILRFTKLDTPVLTGMRIKMNLGKT
jgi:hypothetical protein